VPVSARICGFCPFGLWNLCGFSIEEELLCELQGRIGSLSHRVKILAFQLTTNIGLLKEGGKVNSHKNCPERTRMEFSESANCYQLSCISISL